MANPFGGSDEALSKNSGHTNQANLIYAVVPRTATKFREVIVGNDITVSSGTYDSDGYYIAPSTTLAEYWHTIASRNINQPWTVILGIRRTATGADNGTVSDHMFFGLRKSTANVFPWNPQITIRANKTYAAIAGQMLDHTSAPALSNEPYPLYNVTTVYGVAVKGDGTNQSGFVRIAGTDRHFFPATYSTATDTGYATVALSTASASDLDRIYLGLASQWPFQYLFVYDAALSVANIRSIIDSPGDVLSMAGGDATAALGGSASTPASGTAAALFFIGL